MKSSVSACILSVVVFAATPTLAQSTYGEHHEGHRDGGVFQTCRAQAVSQGLTGEAIHTAVMQCVSASNPEFAARMKCHQDATSQGLTGEQARAFMASCTQK